jgi:hypothetical protein
MKCPDCKGSKVYVPLTGPSEPCRACGGTGLAPASRVALETMRRVAASMRAALDQVAKRPDVPAEPRGNARRRLDRRP